MGQVFAKEAGVAETAKIIHCPTTIWACQTNRKRRWFAGYTWRCGRKNFTFFTSFIKVFTIGSACSSTPAQNAQINLFLCFMVFPLSIIFSKLGKIVQEQGTDLLNSVFFLLFLIFSSFPHFCWIFLVGFYLPNPGISSYSVMYANFVWCCLMHFVIAYYVAVWFLWIPYDTICTVMHNMMRYYISRCNICCLHLHKFL